MKVTGYLLLTLGSVSWLLLFAARMEGASLSPTGLAVSAMLVATGWKFSSFSKAAKRQTELAAGVQVISTVAIPLAPAIRALLDGQLAPRRRVIARVAGGMVLFFTLGGFAIRAGIGGRDGVIAFVILAALGWITAAIVTLSWLIMGELPARRDRQAADYLRSSGEVAVAAVPGGILVRVGDQTFLANAGPAVNALRRLPAATVDHSKHTHVIFEVRDTAGTPVYRLPGYTAAMSS